MCKNRNYLWWFLVIIGALCILGLSFTVRGQEGSSVEDLSELKATVNIQVSWNKHDEQSFSNLEETGSMSTSVTGTLTLDKQQKGVFLFFPESKGMNAEVKYQNETKDKETGELYLKEEGSGSVQVLSPRSLADPQAQGHFEFMAFTGPGGIARALQLSGQVDIASLTEAMTSQENMDHYTFSVATPIQTIVTDKDGNSEDGLRGIHFTLVAEALKDGAISNSLSWTAKEIKYSIGHQNFMGTVYGPPKSGDVNYTVSWTFGEVPVAPEMVDEDEEDDKEDNCERMRQRLNFISLMEAAYQNQALRDIIEKLGDFEGARDLYQELVEQTVLDAINTNETLEDQLYDIENADGEVFMDGRQSSWETPPDENLNNSFEEDPVCEDNEPERVTGSANMKTTPSPNFNDPPGYGSFTITDCCTGSPVVVEMYDGQGNLVYDGGLDSSLTCWQEKYGNGAGEGMWKGAVEHERGHVKQISKGGGTDSVDKLAERELECYEIERKEIEKKMEDLDC